MEILVLVCALTVSAPNCQAETSLHRFFVSDPQSNHAGCPREGLMYAAQSGLVAKGTYPKVVCVPRGAARAVHAGEGELRSP
jgi:hypothetical protein